MTKVMTGEQERVFERLLAAAGTAEVLGQAFSAVFHEKGDTGTLDDLLHAIWVIRMGQKGI